MRRLNDGFAVVVGLGAVGSYAVEALARAGVGRLRLVDFDVVKRSNINRQLYAMESTLGQSKADLARRRVLDIRPDCRVEAMGLFAHVETFDAILDGPPDVVIDAIDALHPKVELLLELSRRGIPVVSSMGAALRTDPTMIRVRPLARTQHCPLASRIRKRLRRREGSLDFPCVFSIEPDGHLPANAVAPAETSDIEEYQRGRHRRTLGSLPTVTGAFGLTAANEALRILAGEHFPRPSEPRPS